MKHALDLVRRVAFSGKRLRTYLILAVQRFDERPSGRCPCCGFSGRFIPEPHLAMAALCPECGSLERQRLFALACQRGFLSFAGADVLHFAPDRSACLAIDAMRPARHLTADAAPGRAELRLDIERLECPDAAFDRVVCSHVLEHVDDRRALAELFRVLRPGGQAAIMVPVAEGWARTYENAAVRTECERALHFGQSDHVRLYGADIRERIAAAGFVVDTFTASGEDTAAYRLLPGETVFRATKPAGVRL